MVDDGSRVFSAHGRSVAGDRLLIVTKLVFLWTLATIQGQISLRNPYPSPQFRLCYNSDTVDMNSQMRERMRSYLAYARRAIKTGQLALRDEDYSAASIRA